MTGLGGQNDNNIQFVGIAPEALSISQKVAWNKQLFYGLGAADSYVLENDDLLAGVDWALNNDVNIISMSFTGYFSNIFKIVLQFAYEDFDVLLLSGERNSSGGGGEPQSWSHVDRKSVV